MAWRRIGDKPLSEPMLIRLTDAYCSTRGDEVNSLAPSRSSNFKSLISKHMLQIKFMGISCEIAHWWISDTALKWRSTSVFHTWIILNHPSCWQEFTVRFTWAIDTWNTFGPGFGYYGIHQQRTLPVPWGILWGLTSGTGLCMESDIWAPYCITGVV